MRLTCFVVFALALFSGLAHASDKGACYSDSDCGKAGSCRSGKCAGR